MPSCFVMADSLDYIRFSYHHHNKVVKLYRKKVWTVHLRDLGRDTQNFPKIMQKPREISGVIGGTRNPKEKKRWTNDRCLY